MLHTVTKIIKVEDQKLTLQFNTGEVLVIDLKEKLKEWSSNAGSKWAELKNFNNFKKVKLDDTFGSVIWENGLDLCPDVLYNIGKNSKEKKAA